MTMVSAIRALTITTAALYALELVPWESIAMFLDHGLGIFITTAHSWILTLGRVGVCVGAVCAVIVVFAAVPRSQYGVPLLSVCFLVMWVSSLTALYWLYIDRYLGWYSQVPTVLHALLHSLPPFLLFVMLRQRAVTEQLQRT